MLRLAAVYGPLYHSMANLPSRLCHAAVEGTSPNLEGVRGGTPYAEETQDLCYVKDCAAGIQLVHMSGRLCHRVYNVGAGRAVRNAQLARVVATAIPRAVVALPSGRPRAHVESAYMDISRIQEDTGYAPSHDIASGVEDYVRWLRARRGQPGDR